VDGSPSLWYANVRHGNREIAEAISAQLAELETLHVFGDLANRPALSIKPLVAGGDQGAVGITCLYWTACGPAVVLRQAFRRREGLGAR
jgi:adenosylmethionine-8-amino-7-oxononanoate aminotransferase